MWFSCFHVLPGSAEAQVIWGGIAKRLLIAYFIDNISAKKISKSINVHQSYSKLKVGRFLRHGVYYGETIAECNATDKTYEFKRDILLNVSNVQIAT